MSTAQSPFQSLPDLASRAAGGAVVWADDDGLRAVAERWSLSG